MRLLLPVFGLLILFLLQGCSAIESMKASEEKDHRIAKTHVELGVGYIKQGKFDIVHHGHDYVFSKACEKDNIEKIITAITTSKRTVILSGTPSVFSRKNRKIPC